MAKTKHPADFNQKAKSIVDLVTGEVKDKEQEQDELKSAAALLGRKGGLKGGKARAENLSPRKRKAIARKAANVRWKKK